MNFPDFHNLPDDAQLWVYGFDKKMDPRLRAEISGDFGSFLSSWTSHNEPVEGAAAIVENRFVLLAGHCGAGIGGCSIDGSVAVVKSLREKYGLDGFNRDLVFFRGGDNEVDAVTREEFQKGVENGRFGDSTVVFDLTLTNLRALRKGRFETTFDKCWHARVFAPHASLFYSRPRTDR
jgi:hypothetical protein